MAENFFQLSTTEQNEIINSLSPQIGLTPQVIEKDIWVCWVLDKLFSMPNALPMVFKGGTSLSKIFNAIQRFSEDCDITIDYLGFNTNFDPFADNMSKTALKKFTEKLRNQLRDYVYSTILPYFRILLANQFGDFAQIKVSEDGEQVWITYPTTTENFATYINSHVLLEFGARNSIEPNNKHTIQPIISNFLRNIEFPHASVNVLSPLRTFWEKATLIHAECHRGEFRESANRLSRHWYDLAVLSQHPIGQSALTNYKLLQDVVKYKKIFYSASHAQYELCLQGEFKFFPDKANIISLHSDYNQMIQAGMFSQQPLSFERVITLLERLQKNINENFNIEKKISLLEST